MFAETRASVEAALQRLALCRETGRFDLMPAEGAALDGVGALRADEWESAWTWSRDHAELPTLVALTAMPEGAVDLSSLDRLVAALRAHPGWTRDEWAAFLAADATLAATFGDGHAALAAIEGAARDLARPPTPANDTAPPQRHAEQARDFSTIAFALATKARDEDPSARGVIQQSCRDLFGVDATPPDFAGRVPDGTIREAASRLAEGRSYERCAEVMDHLLRVVLADRVVDAHEREILGVVAPLLGMSATVLDDRVAAIEEAPADHAAEAAQREDSGTITCGVCKTVLPEDAVFCGECGKKLAAPVVAAPRASVTEAASSRADEGDDGEADDAPNAAVRREGRRDTRAGYEFERWFAAELKERGFADVRKGPDSKHGTGRPDFEVMHEGRRMVLELKHIARASSEFHWSKKQVEEARQCVGDGYYLVIGRPIGDGRYELFWCARPHDVFRTRVRRICHRYEHTHDVTHTPDFDVWNTPTPPVSQDGWRHTLEFIVEVTEGDYDALKIAGQGFEPLVRWRNVAR